MNLYENLFDFIHNFRNGNTLPQWFVEQELYDNIALRGNSINAAINRVTNTNVTMGTCYDILSNLDIDVMFEEKESEIRNWFQCLPLATDTPNQIQAKFDNHTSSNILKEDIYIEEFKDILDVIFNYDLFSNKNGGFKIIKGTDGTKETWGAYELTKLLNINVCPYCNRNYTFTVTTKSSKIARPDLDHFFEKTRHPLFRLSFHNLVPSCKTCNSTLKGSKKFSLDKYLHPYEKGFTEEGFVFSYLYDNTLNKYKVELIETKNSSLASKINNNKQLFRLEEIYSEHSDYIEDLVNHIIKYKDYYENGLSQSVRDLFPSMEEYYRFAFGNYYHSKDYEKRALAKLTKDIIVQLGVLDLIK